MKLKSVFLLTFLTLSLLHTAFGLLSSNKRKPLYTNDDPELKYSQSYHQEFQVDTVSSKDKNKGKLFIQKAEKLKLKQPNQANQENKANNKDPKKPPLPPGIFPPNVKFIFNTYLDMKEKATYVKNTKCKEKTGLLYLLKVQEVLDEKDPTKKEKKVTLKPSYISLSETSFSVQNNQIPQYLVQAVLLNKILRVTQEYKGTTCFDIIEEKKEMTPLQFCAESKDEMDEWIIGILEFKECLLKERFEIIDANSNAFAKKPDKLDVKNGKGVVPPKRPPPPVNPLAKVETPVKPVVIPDALYYTNTFAPTKEVQEITEADETLTKILNNKKREELAQRQIKRQIEDKIRKVKEAHKKIMLQERKMAKRNAANKKKEIALANQKIEDNAKNKQKKILDDAAKKMDNLNVRICLIRIIIILNIRE